MRQHGGSSASVLWGTRFDPQGRRAGRLVESAADAPPGPNNELSATTHLGGVDTKADSRKLLPDPPGFRHFLKPQPRLDDCFTLDGKLFDPSNEADWARAQDLMGKLAQLCMVAPVAPTSRDNRDVPSGYTYLLQLVAHDLVHSSVLLSRNNNRLFAFGNVRDMPLRLETVYGGGPGQCPHAYQSDLDFRHRLRLGQTRQATLNNGKYALDPKSLRDVARGTAGTAVDGAVDKYSEPCIADPRNDSHAIISQLVTVFHILHNEIEDRMNCGGHISPLKDRIANVERLFIAAHIACVLIYRAIIRHDMLPKILHNDVRRAYESKTLKPTDAAASSYEWRAPIELTHGFLRFAHAMIRAHYSLNERTNFPTDESGKDGKAFTIADVLRQGSGHAVSRMPFELKWLVDWKRFFGVGAVNFSALISPLGNPGLEVGIQATDKSKILIERDLLSSLAVQPLSIRTIAKALPESHQSFLSSSPFLRFNDPTNCNTTEPPPWYGPMSEWLTSQNDRRGRPMTPNDIHTLANDPPIPFFVRFEAEQDPDIRGKHLGVLGSIVVADVIYGIFQNDPIVGIDTDDKLQEQLRNLAKTLFGADTSEPSTVFEFIGEMSTFCQLMTFLGDKITYPSHE